MSHINSHDDLEAARTYLQQHPDTKVVAAKDGAIIGYAHGKGVRPILELAHRLGDQLQGASVADRVIGRAAGFVLISSQVDAAYGEVLSREAQELLEAHGIRVAAGEMVPYIEGPDRTGRCLMEQKVHGAEDPDEAVRRLCEFLGLNI